MDAEVLGDKGKVRAATGPSVENTAKGDDAMWAVILTKELWRKGIWYVSFLCFVVWKCMVP